MVGNMTAAMLGRQGVLPTRDLAPSMTRPEDQPLRVGVIGTGIGGAVHIPALMHLPDADVVAVCARREDRARQVAATHGIDYATADFREMVRDPRVEAVVVATPPYLHHQMTLAALEAGKHVLCEKPMARNLAEARDMVKMAERMGVVAMVNHEYRFTPARARAKELIDEGYLGEPHAATFTVFRSSLADPHGRPYGWLMQQDKAGGMLGATGSHHVDALRWWFGEVKSVAGAVATMVKKRRLPGSNGMATVDADDNFSILLRFVNGALGTIHVCATAPGNSGEEIMLAGSEGMLMIHGDDRLVGTRRGEPEIAELPIPERLNPEGPEFSHFLTRPVSLLMAEWLRAIRTGEPVSPSFADGAKIQEVLDGVSRSSAQGRWIDVGVGRFPVAGPTRL